MKVLLLSHTCQSATEGQPRAAEIARRLDGELMVITPARWKHYGKWRAPQIPAAPEYRFEVLNAALPWTGPGQCYLHGYPGLASVLKSFRPDIIDIWEEPWSLVSAQACFLRNRLLPEARIISETEQNLDRRYPPPFSWFRAYTLAHADYAIGRSAEALSIIHSQGYTGPGETVPNGVDPAMFHPMLRAECRRKLGFNGFVVGYAGRIVEQKGLADLVDALSMCPPNVNLVFAGSGDFLPSLQRRAEALGLAARVRFLPERPLEQLGEFMNAMDLFALPSRTTPSWKEQFGRVIIEAHACATPVIGSDSGAIPEVIGKGGLIFAEQNPPELARLISALACDSYKLRELGNQGLKQVLAHDTWSSIADRMIGIYRKARRRH